MSSSSTSVSMPVSGHSTSEVLSLVEEIKKYKTKDLIDFLCKEEDLELEEEDLEIIRKQRVNGRTFFKITKEELERHGMKLGPATALVDFAKECNERKLRSFSSYKTKKDLSEVLAKYGVDGNGMENIPLFELQTHEIPESDKHYKHCLAEILVRLKNYGTLQPDSLEAMRNEYVVAILHTAINIARDVTSKHFSMRPECEIIGNENSGQVDYAIKEAENLICITEDKIEGKIIEGFAQNIVQLESSYETNKKKRKRGDEDFDYLYGIVSTGRDWHFLLYLPGEIYRGSKLPYTIEFTDDALKEETKERQGLCESVKRVLGVVVGLLKDRACLDDEPERKKTRIEGYRLKK